MCLKFHPDKAGESEKDAAQKKFLEVQKAHEVLSDTLQRRTYDDERSRSRGGGWLWRLLERRQLWIRKRGGPLRRFTAGPMAGGDEEVKKDTGRRRENGPKAGEEMKEGGAAQTTGGWGRRCEMNG